LKPLRFKIVKGIVHNGLNDLFKGKDFKIDRQQHNSTETTTSRCNFKLFHAFKMSVAIAFLLKNAAEAI
jgi:hypothetical protein